MTEGIGTYYLGYDQVGSLRVVADSSGNIVKRIDYDSFGNIINDTNPSFSIPFGFAGGLHDRDTGLVRFGFRDYLPELGKWTAKDPIDFAAGDSNLYGYVQNDPINFIDPEGLINTSVGVTHATTTADIAATIATAPTSGPKAVAAAVSIMADSGAFHSAHADSIPGKAFNYSSSVVGAGAAYAAASPLGVGLSGFGLGYTIGSDIAQFPVLGSDQTITDWWADFWWDLFNSCEGKK